MGRDLLPYGLPMEKMVHDACARGRLPVWSEDISGGRPLLANPNSGALYPLRPLLSQLPFPLAMRVFPVLQWVIAGVGMVLLLQSLAVSRSAAWLGAATYVFSGVMVSEVFYLPNAPSAALQPWVLWSVARPAAGLGRKAVPIGVVFGLLFLLGDAVAVLIALLVSLLWIALEAARAERLRHAGALLLGLVLGGLLAAPQIVATALLVPETHRAVTGIPLREALAFTLSPWRLVELVVPYPFGDFWTLDDPAAWGSTVFRGYFVTLYAGALAVVSLVALWRVRRPGARFGRALFVVGFLLAIVFQLFPAGWRTRTVAGPAALSGEVRRRGGVGSRRARGPRLRPVPRSGAASGVDPRCRDRPDARGGGGQPALRLSRATVAASAVGASVRRRVAGRQLAGRARGSGDALGGHRWSRWSCCGVRAAGGRRLRRDPDSGSDRREQGIARIENEASVFPPTVFARAICVGTRRAPIARSTKRLPSAFASGPSPRKPAIRI